jgi:hypothetical protein
MWKDAIERVATVTASASASTSTSRGMRMSRRGFRDYHRWHLYLVLVIVFSLVSQWNFAPSIISSVESSEFVSPNGNLNVNKESSYLFNTTTTHDDVGNLADSSLPQWMKEYFEWHAKRLDEIQKHAKEGESAFNWNEQRLLILRCVSEDRCGGTSDRLKSIPLFLALAAKTHRLLFVRWNRPFPLEDFLLPGPFLNWSVPASLHTVLLKLDNNNHNHNNQTNKTSSSSPRAVYFDGLKLPKLVAATEDPTIWLVEGNVHVSGTNLYRKLASQLLQTTTAPPQAQASSSSLDYASFYHELFPSLFVPAKPIERLVQQLLNDHHLRPNQFVVAHYRSKYPGEPYVKTWNRTLLEETVVNAIHCASSLAPGLPIYVASDTVASLQAAQRYAASNSNNNNTLRVVSHSMGDGNSSNTSSSSISRWLLPAEDPPHLNFAQRDDPSAFYSIFVDLMIMSKSRCVSFGAGGFGRFGSLVSFNVSCRIPHSIKGKMQHCPTTPTPT